MPTIEEDHLSENPTPKTLSFLRYYNERAEKNRTGILGGLAASVGIYVAGLVLKSEEQAKANSTSIAGRLLQNWLLHDITPDRLYIGSGVAAALSLSYGAIRWRAWSRDAANYDAGWEAAVEQLDLSDSIQPTPGDEIVVALESLTLFDQDLLADSPS